MKHSIQSCRNSTKENRDTEYILRFSFTKSEKLINLLSMSEGIGNVEFAYSETKVQQSASELYVAGTAKGLGLVGPRPHHFFAPPPPLLALKRKIIKMKKRLETRFFRLYSAILSVFSLISNARHFVGLLCFSR